MKKFKLKHLLYLAVMVFGAFTFTGCSDDNDEERNGVLSYDFGYLNNLSKMSSNREIESKLKKDGFSTSYDEDGYDVVGEKSINRVKYIIEASPKYADLYFQLSSPSDEILKSYLDAIFKSENKIANKNPEKILLDFNPSTSDKNDVVQIFYQHCMKHNHSSVEFSYTSFRTIVDFYFGEDEVSIDMSIEYD